MSKRAMWADEDSLTQRYLYAVSKELPRKGCEDVVQELRGLIEDMLKERCPQGEPTQDDVRAVLTQMGSPDVLAAKYGSIQGTRLIGQPYYSMYLQALRILLCVVTIGLAIGYIVLGLMQQEPLHRMLLDWLGATLVGGSALFTATTICFALLDRKKVAVQDGCYLEDLPPVPKKKEGQIDRLESICALVLFVVFAIVFVALPQIVAVRLDGGDGAARWIPLFDLEKLRGVAWMVVLFSVLGIVEKLAQLREGRYTTRLCVIALTSRVLSVVLACWMFSVGFLINPSVVVQATAIFTGNASILAGMLTRLPLAMGTVCVLASLLNIVETIYRTVRYGERPAKAVA